MIALMRQRRRVGCMIVTRDEQNAATSSRPGKIHVLEHIAAAVYARTLSVPHGEDAVVVRASEEVHLLGAPHRRRGQLFVDARLKLDAVRVEMLAGLPQRLVQPAEWRAAITGDEAAGI